MSNTLKLEYRDWLHGHEADGLDELGPGDVKQGWICDVTQVTKIGVIQPEDWDAGTWRNGSGPFSFGADMWEVWCWSGRIGLIRTGLMVSTANGDTRKIICERAWLLGPTGGTIERICP